MASLRDIKTRIESVKSTKQITNAMKMVAASKLRKAQDRIVQARPYANHINDILSILKYKNSASIHPLLQNAEEGKKNALVVVTSDRGLCGAFNSIVLRKATSYLKEHPETEVICIGKKGADFMSKHHDKVIENYVNLFNEMNFSVSKDVASFLLDLYLEKGYGRIDVLYNEFKSAIQQNLTIKPILPITPYIPAASEDPKEDEAGGDDSEVTTLDYIYEPDEDTIIEELGVKYINVEVWRIMLESSASEQGARMTAMDSATENAAEMIDKLVLTYNRIRQAGITKEIIEIASGAEAIK